MRSLPKTLAISSIIVGSVQAVQSLVAMMSPIYQEIGAAAYWLLLPSVLFIGGGIMLARGSSVARYAVGVLFVGQVAVCLYRFVTDCIIGGAPLQQGMFWLAIGLVLLIPAQILMFSRRLTEELAAAAVPSASPGQELASNQG